MESKEGPRPEPEVRFANWKKDVANLFGAEGLAAYTAAFKIAQGLPKSS